MMWVLILFVLSSNFITWLFGTKLVRDKEQHRCWYSFCVSWAADSEYVLHSRIHWTACRISRSKVKSKAKMALFETKIVRDEENHRCWVSFYSPWDADSEYVVHYLIPWSACRISCLTVKSKAKMGNGGMKFCQHLPITYESKPYKSGLWKFVLK